MPSQLLKNDKISFVVVKPFTSRGKEYAVGDDFPQEEARDIEVFVRARYVTPVVDSMEDKQQIRHWHRHIRPKDEVLERLNRERVQLRMPHEDEVELDANVLAHPWLATPEPTPEDEADTGVSEDSAPEEPAEEPDNPGFDPADHTVAEVHAYLDAHPDDAVRVLSLEASGRARKGLLEE